MLIYNVRSGNVYENKRNMDKLTARKSDIYGYPTWILQKSSEFDRQFVLFDTFRADFFAIFAAKISSPSKSRQRGGPARAEGHSPRVKCDRV